MGLLEKIRLAPLSTTKEGCVTNSGFCDLGQRIPGVVLFLEISGLGCRKEDEVTQEGGETEIDMLALMSLGEKGFICYGFDWGFGTKIDLWNVAIEERLSATVKNSYWWHRFYGLNGDAGNIKKTKKISLVSAYIYGFIISDGVSRHT